MASIYAICPQPTLTYQLFSYDGSTFSTYTGSNIQIELGSDDILIYTTVPRSEETYLQAISNFGVTSSFLKITHIICGLEIITLQPENANFTSVFARDSGIQTLTTA